MKAIVSLLMIIGFTGSLVAQKTHGRHPAAATSPSTAGKKNKDKKVVKEKERLRHHHPHRHERSGDKGKK